MKCDDYREYYYSFLTAPASVDPAVAAHLSQCTQCQADIAQLQAALAADEPPRDGLPDAALLGLHYQLCDQWVTCPTVRPLLPSLLLGRFAAATPVTAHLEHCPVCQAAMKRLGDLDLPPEKLIAAGRYWAGDEAALNEFSDSQRPVLASLNDPAPAEVRTRLSLHTPSGDPTSPTWVSDAYTIDVKRFIPAAVTRRRTVGALVSSGIAAAVLLAVLLTLQTTPAKALDVTDIYHRLEAVKNVHIQVLSEELDVVRSIWIADNLGVRLFQQADGTIFWNQHTGEMYRRGDGGPEQVSQGHVPQLERPWGLLPFRHIAELPADRQWGYVDDAELDGMRVQIYELTWTQPGARLRHIQKTWRGYLDPQTHLPVRIEWTETVDGDPVRWTMIIRYPTDEECRRVIEAEGFQKLIRTNPAAPGGWARCPPSPDPRVPQGGGRPAP